MFDDDRVFCSHYLTVAETFVRYATGVQEAAEKEQGEVSEKLMGIANDNLVAARDNLLLARQALLRLELATRS